MIKQL